MATDESAFEREGRKLTEEGLDAEVPDGEEARGAGEGIEGAGPPTGGGTDPARSDLQDDLGEDPTLIDEDSGD